MHGINGCFGYLVHVIMKFPASLVIVSVFFCLVYAGLLTENYQPLMLQGEIPQHAMEFEQLKEPLENSTKKGLGLFVDKAVGYAEKSVDTTILFVKNGYQMAASWLHKQPFTQVIIKSYGLFLLKFEEIKEQLLGPKEGERDKKEIKPSQKYVLLS